MGIHKFYGQWILNYCQGATLKSLPPVGSLYIDGNSLVHQAASMAFGYGSYTSYGLKLDPEYKILHQERLRGMLQTRDGMEVVFGLFFQILTTLILNIVQLVKPQHEFYFALDGVVPVAKIIQQRLRRFGALYENTSYTVGDFDTCNITAGTPFMDRLDVHLRHFFCNLETISSVKFPPRRVFSPSNRYGEGEHKLMDYIRVKTLDDLHHVVIGGDSDLCILCCLQDHTFIWMRDLDSERGINLEDLKLTDFQGVLDVTKIRNKILATMVPVVQPRDISQAERDSKLVGPSIELLPGPSHSMPDMDIPSGAHALIIDYTRVIRDFTLISFLIGDDFVPALITMNQDSGATLQVLMETYRRVAFDFHCRSDNQIFSLVDQKGDLMLPNLKIWFRALVEIEKELLAKRVAEQQEKQGEKGWIPSPVLEPMDYSQFNERWLRGILWPVSMFPRVYGIDYQEVLQIPPMSLEDQFEDLDLLCRDYLTGMTWNIKYYLQGHNKVNQWYYQYLFPPSIGILDYFFNRHDVLRLNLPSVSDPIEKITKVASAHQLFIAIHPTTIPRLLDFGTGFKNRLLKYHGLDQSKSPASFDSYQLAAWFPQKAIYLWQGEKMYKNRERATWRAHLILPPPDVYHIIKKIKSSSKNVTDLIVANPVMPQGFALYQSSQSNKVGRKKDDRDRGGRGRDRGGRSRDRDDRGGRGRDDGRNSPRDLRGGRSDGRRGERDLQGGRSDGRRGERDLRGGRSDGRRGDGGRGPRSGRGRGDGGRERGDGGRGPGPQRVEIKGSKISFKNTPYEKLHKGTMVL